MRMLKLREERGLSQEEVAEVLGIKQPAYSELESGTTKLTADYLDRLSKFYGMSMDEFLRADQPVLNMHDHASHGYNVIHTQNQNGLSKDQFKQICDILEGYAAVLRDIAKQQTKMIELFMTRSK